jgi:membrane protease YdiL (CAAX protease family)
MTSPTNSYYEATRHPFSCLLFLAPLLAAYEGGVLYMGNEGQMLRTGADTWLRWIFQTFGLPAMHWPPLVIALIFGVWSWRMRGNRPRDLPGVWLGMTVESVAFALVLWGVGRMHEPILESFGIPLQTPGAMPNRVGHAISYLGAGIYEELLFRLVLFTFLLWAIRLSMPSRFVSALVAMILSALAFSAAHHVGPCGEPLVNRVFVFRALAGLFFVVLYQLRGFGIAVGAHACYDVIVGAASV